ncbi:uncharacterized protein LOC131221169 [Magnolia sinica]|uniref:uncharacterized protein LOC131221169 n=1 Tax=Magnolia sinica TaxID=86752 RepID=UPI00265AAEF6|nr:uncharacterized protein LOC131221169 [Magnolia sinica]
MEPMDIDWKSVESRFVEDELYEHINAPKWIDLSAYSSLVDDEAWFCRPDCRHPKNADDFKVKNLRSANDMEILPLGERNRRDTNLKRRGLLSSASLQDPRSNKTVPEIPRSKKASKKFREDGENENPNRSPAPSIKTFKASIKSSAEKKPAVTKMRTTSFESSADSPQVEQRPLPRLKSTLSARNLFAGKEILNQITEFCSELKKLAVSTRERENSVRSDGKEKEKEPLMEEERQISGGGVLEEKKVVTRKEKAGKALNLNSKIFSPEAWRKKRSEDLDNIQASASATDLKGGCKGNESPSQVRWCPPSPQRFPSPYNRQKPLKTTPLKPSKSRTAGRGILQEVEQNKRIAKESVEDEENQNISISGTEEARSLDVFWFLKPCAYLAK